jgi:hypothetical protein
MFLFILYSVRMNINYLASNNFGRVNGQIKIFLKIKKENNLK